MLIGFLATLLVLVSLFLILLVLIQRGRGGGLAGALGGMGGQSAFGTKAGDLFTKITIGAATVWIVLCIFSVKVMTTERDNRFADDLGRNAISPEPTLTTPDGSNAPLGEGLAAEDAAADNAAATAGETTN